jgi:hypothetical protein
MYILVLLSLENLAVTNLAMMYVASAKILVIPKGKKRAEEKKLHRKQVSRPQYFVILV